MFEMRNDVAMTKLQKRLEEAILDPQKLSSIIVDIAELFANFNTESEQSLNQITAALLRMHGDPMWSGYSQALADLIFSYLEIREEQKNIDKIQSFLSKDSKRTLSYLAQIPSTTNDIAAVLEIDIEKAECIIVMLLENKLTYPYGEHFLITSLGRTILTQK